MNQTVKSTRWTETTHSNPEGISLKHSILVASVCCALQAAGMARAAEESSAVSGGTASDNQEGTRALEEVTVTATRRSERLQDVPYNISSVSASSLQQAGLSSVSDLAQAVAGLQTMDTGPNTRGGSNQFSMRGLRTDSPGSETDAFRSGTVAPVSTYLGETPIFFPLALKDLERVEVLKGPQGTLYGSGALAGTVRFIPARPDFDEFSAKVDLQSFGTDYSDKLSGSGDGVVNIPMGDTLAMRVSAGYEHLGGFIDSVNLVQRAVPGDPTSAPVLRVPDDPRSGYVLAPIKKDTNSSDRWYVRPTLRWRPTDALEAELSYMHQDLSVDNMQIVNPAYPGGTFSFDSSSGNPNAVNTYRPSGRYKSTSDILQPSENVLDLGSLVVTADLGAVSLTSASSLYEMDSSDRASYVASAIIYDAEGQVATNYYDYFNGYPRGNAQAFIKQRERSFIQELRLVSTWDKPVDYVVGLYYQDQRLNFASQTTEPGYTEFLAAIGDPGLPRPGGDLMYQYPGYSGFQFEDRAVFGELTWHVTSRWQATVGARSFHQEFRNRQTALNTYFTPEPVVDLDVDNTNKVDDQIYKFNTSYDFTPDFKVYATYSEGFRRGGANALPVGGAYASLPSLLSYAPDKSKNTEVGVKGQSLDKRLRYTADVFLIKLENFQFNAYSGAAFPAVFNGNEAESRGAELSAEFQVTPDFSFALSYAYTDATVPRGFTIYDLAPLALLEPAPAPLIPAVTFADDARLPVTPKSSGNVAVNYSIPLGSTASLRFHADAMYRGSAPGYVDPNSSRYWEIPSSTVVNARVTFDSGESWSADLFINNLTDETVYSGAFGTGQTAPNLFQQRYVGRPRSYGVGLHYNW